jgi:hypothetical protein
MPVIKLVFRSTNPPAQNRQARFVQSDRHGGDVVNNQPDISIVTVAYKLLLNVGEGRRRTRRPPPSMDGTTAVDIEGDRELREGRHAGWQVSRPRQVLRMTGRAAWRSSRAGRNVRDGRGGLRHLRLLQQ